MKAWASGLQAKMIVWFLTPTIIILAAVGLVAYTAHTQTIETLSKTRELEFAQLSAAQVASELTQYTTALAAFSEELSDIDGETAYQRKLNQSTESLAPFDAGVLILNKRGIVIAATPPRPNVLKQNWLTADHPYIGQVRQTRDLVISNLVPHGPDGTDVIVLAQVILAENDQVQGIVAGMVQMPALALKAPSFTEASTQPTITPKRVIFIVDGNGRILQHEDTTQIGEAPASNVAVQRVLQGEVDALRTEDAKGQRILASFAPIPGTSWGIVTWQMWGALLRESRGYAVFFYLLLILGLIVPLIILALQSRNLIQPIKTLSSNAQDLARGEFPPPIDLQTGDELEELAGQFNAMSSQLQKVLTSSQAHLVSAQQEKVTMEERELRYRNLFERIPLGLYRLTSLGQLLTVNPALMTILGYTDEASLQQVNWSDFYIDGPDYERWHNLMTHKGIAMDFEAKFRHHDGNTIWVKINSRTVLDADGQVRYYEGSLEDITECKQTELMLVEYSQTLEQEIEQRNTELTQALQKSQTQKENKQTDYHSQRAFLTTMSHELRTPLNAILGHSELLLQEAQQLEDEGVRNGLQKIHAAGQRLLVALDHIMELEQMEIGGVALQAKSFDLRHCLESALDAAATEATKKKLTLDYLVMEDVPRMVVGDELRLSQVLDNLLNNTIKFTEAGEIALTLSGHPVSAARGNRDYALHFAIQYTGVGSAFEQAVDHLQSDRGDDDEDLALDKSVSLGLMICRRLISLMGGEIWGERENEQGSTLHFTIQVQAAPGGKSFYWVGEHPQFLGKRLLIAESHKTTRDFLKLQTQAWGMEVVSCTSAFEVLERLREGEIFHLALLDFDMPDIDGLTLTNEMKHYVAGANLPVIVMRAQSPAPASSTTASGKSSVQMLSKPLKAAEIYAAFDQILTTVSPAIPTPESTVLAPERQTQDEIHSINGYIHQAGKHPPLKILIAEDNKGNQELALLMLERMGYQADVVDDGTKVLATLKQRSYDVILMDVQMPQMNGLQTTRRIRADFPPNTQPRIIAMTANALHGDRERCLEAGMDDYISKPIHISELIAALQESPAPTPEPTPPVVPDVEPVAADTEPEPSAPEPPILMTTVSPDVLDIAVMEQLQETFGEQAHLSLPPLIDSFHDSTLRLIGEARRALRAEEVADLNQAAHAIKSTSISMGAVTLSEIAEQLEEDTAETIPEAASDTIDHIEAEYRKVKPALEAYREQLKKAAYRPSD